MTLLADCVKIDWLRIPPGVNSIRVLAGHTQSDDEPEWAHSCDIPRPKPVRKMTWDEIEDALGYRVELVNADDLP